jgi:nondiscriminating glutamyl-tRNA synthetase
MPVRVRYAPSPTGHLHIAGARTALFDYLLARKSGGQFVIRFEDTDQARHLESGIHNQLDGLRWLGIEWDESVDIGGPYAPYRQTERLDLYRPYTERLLGQGDVYPCYCTESELDEEYKAQEARGETPHYSGRCRQLDEEEKQRFAAEGRVPCYRFRVSEGDTISFDDQVRGTVEFDSNGIGDFVIVRPDGIPTYNYAVVLDDLMMKITHVIRGEEHLSNTPRQLLIYRALGAEAPVFAHTSLILNQDRKKMSKRDESIVQFVQQYQELGYLPEAVLNFIALLGWSPRSEEEIYSKDELIEQFGLDRLSKSPAIFDTDKLNWMSNHYMKKADLQKVVELAIPHLQKAASTPGQLDSSGKQWVDELVQLYQEQLTYAAEIVQLTGMFFREQVEFEEDAAAMLKEDYAPAVLGSFQRHLSEVNEEHPTAEEIKGLLKKVQAETGYKGKQLFMTVRAALTGQLHGRDLNETLHLLGKNKMAARLQTVLS